MNRMKISSIFLILILALSLLPVMSFVTAAERSYSILMQHSISMSKRWKFKG